jgi:hypothetical protein
VTPVAFLPEGKLLSQLAAGPCRPLRHQQPAPAALDFPAYQIEAVRAMTFAELEVETSDDKSKVLSVTVIDSILDPGWTPPFDRTITLLTRVYVPEPSMADPAFYAGELGLGSSILPRIQHRNSTFAMKVAQDELVASGLILFRAGKHTDDIGVKTVKCPYHVPWVWCEWLVTHKAGKFTVYGTGSVFPTHSFYAQGVCFGQQDEPTDAKFTRSWRHPLTIDTSALRVYPVLTTGAPASGAQVADTTNGATGRRPCLTRSAAPATTRNRSSDTYRASIARRGAFSEASTPAALER